jgi:hypothetical protein
MDPEIQKLIGERVQALPPQVKEALRRVDIAAQLVDIVRTHTLRIDQAGTLETETIMAILGIESLRDFTNNIARELHIPEERARSISADINERIFKAVRLEMASPQTSNRTVSTHTLLPWDVPKTLGAEHVGAKLDGSVHTPPETVVVHETAPIEQRIETLQKPPLSQALGKATYPTGVDPYREPTS